MLAVLPVCCLQGLGVASLKVLVGRGAAEIASEVERIRLKLWYVVTRCARLKMFWMRDVTNGNCGGNGDVDGFQRLTRATPPTPPS